MNSDDQRGRTPLVARGDEVEVRIERLVAGGDGLGHLADGRVLFVRGAVPDEHARVRVVGARRRWVRGELIAHLAPPAASECPLVDRCGGCPWLRAPLRTQREALAADVGRALSRAAGAPVEVDWGYESTGPGGWRSTTRLHWDTGALGYRRARSAEVLDIPECAALAPPLPALLAWVRARLSGRLHGQGEIRLTAAARAASGTVVVEPADGRGPSPADVRALVETGGPCHGALWRRGDRVERFGEPHNRLGAAAVPHPAEAFAQGHQPGNEALVAAVVAALRGAGRVLELFAGSGNFTLPLAAAGVSITAVEQRASAARALRGEAAAHGVVERLAVVTGDAARWPPGDYRAALIDPPRSGAAESVAALHAQGLPALVYVSCDPSTLARDVAWLVARGWRMDGAQLFDLFPNTGHVEVLARLSRGTAPGEAR